MEKGIELYLFNCGRHKEFLPKDIEANNSKIKRLVPDFVATVPFAQGIKRTIKWFDADAKLSCKNVLD